MRAPAILTLPLLLLGCSGDPQRPSPAAFSGTWVSTFSSELVLLELQTAGRRVRGTADLAPGHAPARYAVEGSVRDAGLTATLRREGSPETVSLRAALRRDTLDVWLDGGGFSERFVPLVRE